MGNVKNQFDNNISYGLFIYALHWIWYSKSYFKRVSNRPVLRKSVFHICFIYKKEYKAGEMPKKIRGLWRVVMKKIQKKFRSNYYKLMNTLFLRPNFALFYFLICEKIFQCPFKMEQNGEICVKSIINHVSVTRKMPRSHTTSFNFSFWISSSNEIWVWNDCFQFTYTACFLI